MESANVSRLQKKLQGRKKRSAPFFECFNRWVFLSRHNQIMFQNRKALADLQAAATKAKKANPAQRARRGLVHALLNHNDFVSIR